MRMDVKTRIRLANAYQREFRKRVKTFQGRFSYAEDTLRQSFKKRTIKTRSLNEKGEFVYEQREINPRYKLFSHINKKSVKTPKDVAALSTYLAKMVNFFNPPGNDQTIHTNTLAGIEANHKRLEAFVFGTGADGQALGTLTESEMKFVMDLYKQYYKKHSEDETFEYMSVFTSIAYLYQMGELNDGKVNAYNKLTKMMELVNKDEIDLLSVDNYADTQTRLEQIQELVDQALRPDKKVVEISEDDEVEVVGRYGDDLYPL